jgi:hypothetical protein
MPSEPDWSKQISSSTVCTWFYAFALLNLFFGAAGVLSGLYYLSKGRTSVTGFTVTVIAALVGFTNSWFFFLMCNRSINEESFTGLRY